MISINSHEFANRRNIFYLVLINYDSSRLKSFFQICFKLFSTENILLNSSTGKKNWICIFSGKQIFPQLIISLHQYQEFLSLSRIFPTSRSIFFPTEQSKKPSVYAVAIFRWSPMWKIDGWKKLYWIFLPTISFILLCPRFRFRMNERLLIPFNVF